MGASRTLIWRLVGEQVLVFVARGIVFSVTTQQGHPVEAVWQRFVGDLTNHLGLRERIGRSF